MKKRNTLWIILIIIFSIIFVSCAFVLVKTYFPDKSYKKYKNESTSSKVTSSKEKKELPDNPIDFAALKEQNPDVCGYIKVDGTVVDYPIMRSGDETPEDFYLDHNWLRKSARSGAIYIQRLNSINFDDPCTIVYGHHMKNGSMFAQINKKFKNKDFFKQNRYITVYKPGHILKYEIFASLTYDNRHILKLYDFSEQADYERFIAETVKPKNFASHNFLEEAKPQFGDKMIILCTCTYTNPGADLRYLLCGKLVEDTPTK